MSQPPAAPGWRPKRMAYMASYPQPHPCPAGSSTALTRIGGKWQRDRGLVRKGTSGREGTDVAHF